MAFMLFALAVALARPYGLATVLVLWAGFVVLLELGYRRLMRFEARKRRRWWAKPHAPGYWQIRFCALAIVLTFFLIFHSPFTRYALLLLLAASLVCAGIIRLINRSDEI